METADYRNFWWLLLLALILICRLGRCVGLLRWLLAWNSLALGCMRMYRSLGILSHSNRSILTIRHRAICGVALDLVEANSLTLGSRLMLKRCLLDNKVIHERLLLLKHHGVRVLINA